MTWDKVPDTFQFSIARPHVSCVIVTVSIVLSGGDVMRNEE